MKKNLCLSQGDSIKLEKEEKEVVVDVLENKNIDLDYFDEEQNILSLPYSYVGFINTKVRNIIIEPSHEEVSISNILQMYFFVYWNNKIIDEKIFEAAPSQLYKKLIDIFIDELETICKKGLPKTYETINDNKRFARGKVDFVKTKSNIKKNYKNLFNCDFDELSYNNNINKILFIAYNKIKKDIIRDKRKKIIEDYSFIINTEVNNIFDIIDNLQIQQKDYYCKKAILLGELIIKEFYKSELNGKIMGDSLLLNFDHLFELYVKKILKQFTYDTNFNEPPDDICYGIYSNKNKYIKPDLLYNYSVKDNKAFAIIDMKNKYYNIFKNPDIYQTIFYAEILNASRIILCYPSVKSKKPNKLEVFNKEFKSRFIHAIYLNIVNKTEESFNKSAKEFIKEIYSLL